METQQIELAGLLWDVEVQWDDCDVLVGDSFSGSEPVALVSEVTLVGISDLDGDWYEDFGGGFPAEAVKGRWMERETIAPALMTWAEGHYRDQVVEEVERRAVAS